MKGLSISSSKSTVWLPAYGPSNASKSTTPYTASLLDPGKWPTPVRLRCQNGVGLLILYDLLTLDIGSFGLWSNCPLLGLSLAFVGLPVSPLQCCLQSTEAQVWGGGSRHPLPCVSHPSILAAGPRVTTPLPHAPCRMSASPQEWPHSSSPRFLETVTPQME